MFCLSHGMHRDPLPAFAVCWPWQGLAMTPRDRQDAAIKVVLAWVAAGKPVERMLFRKESER